MIHPNSELVTQATGQCAESPALTEQIRQTPELGWAVTFH